MKEIRSHGDEVARIALLHLIEGEDPPSELRKDFQQVSTIANLLEFSAKSSSLKHQCALGLYLFVSIIAQTLSCLIISYY